jgi:prepilin-type N-terminal cleavage/methylation domain-containing protein
VIRAGRSRGFTFAEVMVASLILALLTTAGVFLFQFGSRSSRAKETDMELHRQGRQAVARVRREMRGAQVLHPTPDEGVKDYVSYRYPQLEHRKLQVTAAGSPEWAGVARLYQVGENLLLEKPEGSPPRLLAQLKGGQFEVLSSDRFVNFEVRVGIQEPDLFKRSFRVARR